MIDERRKEIVDDPSLVSRGDFLTLLVSDEHFKNRDIRVLDECLTFFFAGSGTSAAST